jgi:hypothetical protein
VPCVTIWRHSMCLTCKMPDSGYWVTRVTTCMKLPGQYPPSFRRHNKERKRVWYFEGNVTVIVCFLMEFIRLCRDIFILLYSSAGSWNVSSMEQRKLSEHLSIWAEFRCWYCKGWMKSVKCSVEFKYSTGFPRNRTELWFKYSLKLQAPPYRRHTASVLQN